MKLLPTLIMMSQMVGHMTQYMCEVLCLAILPRGTLRNIENFPKAWSHASHQDLVQQLVDFASLSRDHEAKLHGCLLGCPGQADRLDHYFLCLLLWNIVRLAFPHVRFNGILNRLCVVVPCTDSLRVLAATFPAYHAIKPSVGERCLSHDTARCRFEEVFHSSLLSAGGSPVAPAD